MDFGFSSGGDGASTVDGVDACHAVNADEESGVGCVRIISYEDTVPLVIGEIDVDGDVFQRDGIEVISNRHASIEGLAFQGECLLDLYFDYGAEGILGPS